MTRKYKKEKQTFFLLLLCFLFSLGKTSLIKPKETAPSTSPLCPLFFLFFISFCFCFLLSPFTALSFFLKKAHPFLLFLSSLKKLVAFSLPSSSKLSNPLAWFFCRFFIAKVGKLHMGVCSKVMRAAWCVVCCSDGWQKAWGNW